MGRSRSKSRRGSAGRPKRSTRNRVHSSTDNGTESTSEKKAKKMRVSPSSPSPSPVSQRGTPTSPKQRRKKMTENRRQIMQLYIQTASETPRKYGKVGSHPWMTQVLKVVNHSAEEKDLVSNEDLMWWLQKHFAINVEDLSRSHVRTRSQSREKGARSVGNGVQENGGSSPAGSVDEGHVINGDVAENSKVGRAKRATSKGPRKNSLTVSVVVVQEGTENVSAAVGNVPEVVSTPEAVQNLEAGTEDSPGVVANSQGALDDGLEVIGTWTAEGVASNFPKAAATAQRAGTSLEVSAANVRPATGVTEKAAATPPPEVIDLDNDSNAEGSIASTAEVGKAPRQSISVKLKNRMTKSAGKNVAVATGSGAHRVGDPARPVVGIPPELEVLNGQRVVVNPEAEKLKLQMKALLLQINMLQKDRRYSELQMEVLTAQAKAMRAMIELLSSIG